MLSGPFTHTACHCPAPRLSNSALLQHRQTDTLHIRMKGRRETASHGERHGDRAEEGVCMALALGSRRFSLGYTNVPRPRVSVTQTCTITSGGPAESPVSQSDEVNAEWRRGGQSEEERRLACSVGILEVGDDAPSIPRMLQPPSCSALVMCVPRICNFPEVLHMHHGSNPIIGRGQNSCLEGISQCQ
ncbi:hypothetical protein QQF64_016456 [Cirrhinus molitorella]|uniref:Uncharacterized protein n=1 Tax=Cirrhinus molitorella TaxID=172907 RepID=A0ABR3LMX4_9TELE